MKFSFAVLSAVLLFLAPAGAVPLQAPSQAGPESQLQSLMRGIFLAESRAHDLLGVVDTSKWKIADSEKSAFAQDSEAAQNDLQTLEKWRYQFLYHPDDVEAASKELEAFGALLPQFGKITDAVTQFGSATDAQQFKQTLGEIAGLRDRLESYLESKFPGKFVPPAPPAASAQAPPSTAPPAKSVPAAAPPSQSSGAPTPATTPPAAAPEESRPAAPPVAQAPASQPAPAEGTTAQPPASSPAVGALTPDQMRALLRGIFLTDARVSDLLSLLQPAKWTMPDSERALFNERLQSIGNQLKAVETSRYQFLYNLQKPDLGEKTASALGNLVDQLLALETTVAQYQGSPEAAQFTHAAEQLAAARNSVGSYAAGLEAQTQKALEAPGPALPGGKALTTERITAPSGAAPPISSLAVATPPLTPGQVKSILENVYVSEFRIRDLLSQEDPETWKKASASERSLGVQARAALLSRVDELEKWRASFSQNPGNMNDAFRTFRAADALFRPLWIFGQEAGKYENEQMAGDYARRENDVEAQLNGLVPYVSFILEHADHNLGTFQADLAACQNQLSYAMHGIVHPAQPMKNIVPVFQGRRVRHADRTDSSHRTRESKQAK